jgi:hypothetical protein
MLNTAYTKRLPLENNNGTIGMKKTAKVWKQDFFV